MQLRWMSLGETVNTCYQIYVISVRYRADVDVVMLYIMYGAVLNNLGCGWDLKIHPKKHLFV